MDLEKQKVALERLANALTLRMETRLNIVSTKDGNAHSLLEVAEDYCHLLTNKRLIEQELERVNDAILFPLPTVA